MGRSHAVSKNFCCAWHSAGNFWSQYFADFKSAANLEVGYFIIGHLALMGGLWEGRMILNTRGCTLLLTWWGPPIGRDKSWLPPAPARFFVRLDFLGSSESAHKLNTSGCEIYYAPFWSRQTSVYTSGFRRSQAFLFRVKE